MSERTAGGVFVGRCPGCKKVVAARWPQGDDEDRVSLAEWSRNGLLVAREGREAIARPEWVEAGHDQGECVAASVTALFGGGS